MAQEDPAVREVRAGRGESASTDRARRAVLPGAVVRVARRASMRGATGPTLRDREIRSRGILYGMNISALDISAGEPSGE